MLYHCVQAGLDMAIINPAHVTAYADIPAEEKELAEDLIFNRRPDALQRYIEHYEKVTPTDQQACLQPHRRHDPRTAPALEDRPPPQRRRVEADIDEIFNRASPWREKLDDEALKCFDSGGQKSPPREGEPEGGDPRNRCPYPQQRPAPRHERSRRQIRRGRVDPALRAAIRRGDEETVAHLENYLEKMEGVTKGLVVIATVYGDVHDIGKNLVKTILANNGYTVIDLGKQVPAETIITKAVEANATAIGLSALLVSTSKQMPLIVNELQRRGHKIPVLVGGAAINRRFGRRILHRRRRSFYEPGVFYCKDAFEGLGDNGPADRP
jgi:5-methyltetrahydrofolate--homocysteine methyltransferase